MAGGVRRGAHGHDPQGDRPVVVGRDVTPVVGMQVQEIIGGLGPGKRPEEVCAGERTGTIRKVIGRLSAQSEKSTTLSCGVVWEEGADMQVRLERTMCCCSAAAFVPDLALSPACRRVRLLICRLFGVGPRSSRKRAWAAILSCC
jgi:hypothetical protein